MPASPHPARVPAFEHVAFPIGLGFVAVFKDLFGFMALVRPARGACHR